MNNSRPQVYCKFGCALKEGGDKVFTGQSCTDKLTFSGRKFHEAQCPWSIVPCPNSTDCGTLLARDVTEHLLECRHAMCENVKYGCEFKGTSADVDVHEEDCKFMVVRGVIDSFKSTIDTLVQEVACPLLLLCVSCACCTVLLFLSRIMNSYAVMSI